MSKQHSARKPGLTPGLGSAPQPPAEEKPSRRMEIGNPEQVAAGATEPLIGRPVGPKKPAERAVRQVREVATAVKRRRAGRQKRQGADGGTERKRTR